MTALAQYQSDSDDQRLYAPHLLASLASRIAHRDESATGWDHFEGYLDPTNSTLAPTRDAYILLYNELSKLPHTRNLFAGFGILNEPEPAEDHGWFRSMVTTIVPSFRTGFGDADHESGAITIFEPLVTSSPMMAQYEPLQITESLLDRFSNLTQLVIQEIEDEILKLEQNISSAIRSSIREQVRLQLNLSIKELGKNQSLAKAKSVRALYRFLSTSQCTIAPDLSLSADGLYYARWRESRTRSVGILFTGGSTVDYALRNRPKMHGGTTSPKELWSLVTELGFDDLLRADRSKAAA